TAGGRAGDVIGTRGSSRGRAELHVLRRSDRAVDPSPAWRAIGRPRPAKGSHPCAVPPGGVTSRTPAVPTPAVESAGLLSNLADRLVASTFISVMPAGGEGVPVNFTEGVKDDIADDDVVACDEVFRDFCRFPKAVRRGFATPDNRDRALVGGT